MDYGFGKYDKEKLKQLQKKLAERVVLKNCFSRVKYVGGVDQAYDGNNTASAIAIYEFPSLKKVEIKHAFGKVDFPYIPGFLSFREGPIIEKAYSKLKIKPDVLLVNGNGIMHFNFIGLASHIGVVLDIPTIGITQNLLCGKVVNGKVYYKNRLVGYEYESRKNCRPIYISPGHKISFKTSLCITKKCITRYKLPLPLHIADRLSKRLIKEQKYSNQRKKYKQ